MEICVGEYVRTRSGQISKVLYVNKDNSFDLMGETYTLSSAWVVKHSKNIIDLIEEGDYVNGKRVFATDDRINDNGEKVILTENYDEWTDDGVVSNKDIKSIVTKEQYKSVEYVF